MGAKPDADEEKPVLNQEEVDRELAGYRELAAQPARRQEAIDGILAVEKKGECEGPRSGHWRVGRQVGSSAPKGAAAACILTILELHLYYSLQGEWQRTWWPPARHAAQCWRYVAWSSGGVVQTLLAAAWLWSLCGHGDAPHLAPAASCKMRCNLHVASDHRGHFSVV